MRYTACTTLLPVIACTIGCQSKHACAVLLSVNSPRNLAARAPAADSHPPRSPHVVGRGGRCCHRHARCARYAVPRQPRAHRLQQLHSALHALRSAQPPKRGPQRPRSEWVGQGQRRKKDTGGRDAAWCCIAWCCTAAARRDCRGGRAQAGACGSVHSARKPIAAVRVGPAPQSQRNWNEHQCHEAVLAPGRAWKER